MAEPTTTKLDLRSLDPKPREVTIAPSDPTLWEADPFYEAAEALQDELDQIQQTLRGMLDTPGNASEAEKEEQQSAEQRPDTERVRRELTAMCDSVEAQVHEFSTVLQVTAQQPHRFHLSDDEMARRRQFVSGVATQVSALRRQLVDSSQFPKATAAASGSKAAGGGSQALRGQSGAAANSGSSTQESAAPHDGFKATSVLVGELGKAPPWEVVKAEEDRKRREQEEALARKEAARQASRRPRGPRNDIEELIYQIVKFKNETDPRHAFIFVLLVIGLVVLNTAGLVEI